MLIRLAGAFWRGYGHWDAGTKEATHQDQTRGTENLVAAKN